MDHRQLEGRALTDAVRMAAHHHGLAWEAMVPDPHSFNFAAEAREEAAFQDMAIAKQALRDHIWETYGITVRELASLASV